MELTFNNNLLFSKIKKINSLGIKQLRFVKFLMRLPCDTRVGNGLKPVAFTVGTFGTIICTFGALFYNSYQGYGSTVRIFGTTGIAFMGLQQAGFWLRHKRYYMKHGWILK